ncbi:MAG: hypothetical protein ACREID_03085 [Planctomycetota bacterium]
MKTHASILLSAALALPAAGCGKSTEPAYPSSSTQAPVPAKAAKAAAIYKEIHAGKEVDEVLAARGMTQADLDNLLEEIAADPELSSAYLAARSR